MKRSFKLMLFFAAAALIITRPLQAATLNWIGTADLTDSFADATKWDTGLAPAAGDLAYINNGHTANISADSGLASLYLGYDAVAGTAVSGAINQTAGTVTLSAGSQFGRGVGSSGTLIMNGGAFDVSGTSYIGYGGGAGQVTMGGSSTYTQTTGSFVMAYNATAGGTMSSSTVSVSGSSTIDVKAGSAYVGYGAGATMSVNDSAKFIVESYYDLNVGFGGFGGVTSTLNIDSTNEAAPAMVEVGFFQIANSGYGLTGRSQTGIVNMYHYAQAKSNYNFDVGDWAGSNGILKMHDNTLVTAGGNGMFIGNYGDAHGEVYMYDNAIINAYSLQIANGEYSATTSGVSGSLEMNNNAEFNVAGGQIFVGCLDYSTASVTMNGSSHITAQSIFNIGNSGNSTGVVTMNDDSWVRAQAGTVIGRSVGSGTLNLNGNSVFRTSFLRGTANGTVKFNGGTLKADDIAGVETNWLGTGVIFDVGSGAKIDMNGNTVTVNGSFSDPGAGGHGLTVSDSLGGGTLILAGTNSYTGMTTIYSGTLQPANAAALPGQVTINTDGTLSLASNLSLTGKILGTAGKVSIDAGGDATLGTNAFSGMILVNGGNLNLTGTHPGNLTINNGSGGTGISWYHTGAGTVSGTTYVGNATGADAILGGSGTLGNVVALSNWGNTTGVKGGIEAGKDGVGSLRMANLTFNGPSFVYVGNASVGIGAYTGTSAALVASGTLTIGAEIGGQPIKFDLGGASVASGTYHLIQHNGAITYLGGSTYENFQVVNAILSARQTASIADHTGTGSVHYLDYTVVGAYPVWSGVNGSSPDNNWYANDATKKNWKANTDGTAYYFFDATTHGGIGDAVLFSDAAGAAHSTVSIPGNVAPASVTVDNSSFDYTFDGPAGIVNETAANTVLVKKGTGTLTIKTANYYAGGTTINNGTIRIGNASALGTDGVVFYPSNATYTAKLQLNSNDITLTSLATDVLSLGTSIVENGGTGNALLTINNITANSYTGVLQDGSTGKLAVTFGGSANLLLGGVSTYTGDTTLAGSADLQIGVDNVLPHGTGKGNVVFNGVLPTIDLNGHNQTVNGLANSSLANITNKLTGTIGTLTVGDGNANSDFSGSLLDTGTGKLALAKVGSGQLTLNDPGWYFGVPSNYSGGTTLSQGTIQTGYAAALGTGSLSMVAGTTLDLLNPYLTDPYSHAITAPSLNVGGLSGSGTITTSVPGNTAILTVTSPAATSTSFTGVIQNGSGQMGLMKAGAGTLTLGSANTYTGVTIVNGGALVVPTLANGGVASSIGASAADPANLVFGSGTFHYTGGAVVLDRGFTTAGAGGSNAAIQLDSDVTFGGTIASTITAWGAVFSKTGPGTLTFKTPDAAGYTSNVLGYGGDGIATEFWMQEGKTVFDGLASDGTNNTTYSNYWFRVGVDPVALGRGPAPLGTPEMDINNVRLDAYAVAIGHGANAVAKMTGTASIVETNYYTIVGGSLNGKAANGSLTMSDSSSLTTGANASYGYLLVGYQSGSNVANATGNLTLNNSATISTGAYFLIGYNGNTGSAISTGTVTLNDSSAITVGSAVGPASRSYIRLGYGPHGIGNLYMHNNSAISASQAYIGSSSTSAMGTAVLDGNAGLEFTATGTGLIVGNTGGTGSLTLGTATTTDDATDTAHVTLAGVPYIGYSSGGVAGSGQLTLYGQTRFTANGTAFRVGQGYGSVGTVTLNNSSQVGGTTMQIGYYGGTGTVALNGSAQLTATNMQVGYNWGTTATDTHGTVNVNGAGALVTVTSEIILGADGGQDGVWNQNAGHTTVGTKVVIGEYDYTDAAASRTAGAGVLNLNGGTLTAPVLSTRSHYSDTIIGPTSGKVNFNGGTLQASADSANYIATDDPLATMTLKVQKNATTGLGAVIDTQGFAVTVTKALQHDTAGAAIDGGLSKLGSGSLVLTGALTYTGNTNIAAGTLQISTPGAVTLSTITGAGALKVTDATTLTATSIHVGTLTIGGTPPTVAAAVPEPGTLVLLALAGLTLAGARIRRK